MSFGWIKRVSHSLGWRIGAWYSLGFFVSLALIALIGDWLLTSAARQQDRHEIMEEFEQDAARCRQIGSDKLRSGSDTDFTDSETTLIRLSMPDGSSAMVVPALGDRPRETRWAVTQLKSHRVRGWQTLSTLGREAIWQVYAEPMPDGWWLQVAKSDYHSLVMQERLGETLLPVAGCVVLFALAGATGLTYHALRPVRRLIQASKSVIDAGDMTARVPTRVRGGHELDELSLLFNRMLSKNETLIRGMREALDSVAHDLRTPLTRLRTSAEAALRNAGATASERGDALAEALEESERALAMLRTLMDISEAEYGSMRLNPERVELVELVEAGIELYAHVAEEREIRLQSEVPAGLKVLADPVRVQQVIANLVDNAVKYSERSGRVVVGAERRPPGEVALIVRDEGRGIPAHDLPRIWDRLYRGDHSRSEQGTGLGLSLVKAIVEAHGGRAEVRSVPGEGAVFTVTLPMAPPPPERPKTVIDLLGLRGPTADGSSAN